MNDPVFSSRIKRVAPVGLVTLITFFALLAFQWAKHVVMPDMTIWESHAITAVFACLVAALGTQLALRAREKVNRQVAQEIAERQRAEAALRHTEIESHSLIERRRHVAEGLHDILAVLNSNHSLDEILDYIVAQANRLLDAEAVALFRLKSEEKQLMIQSARGLNAAYVSQANVPLGQGVVGKSALIGQPVTLADVTCISPDNELLLDREQATALEHLALCYRAVMSVPLMIKGEVYGAIALYYCEPRQFSPEEISLAVAFSHQAALAIANARLRVQAERTAVLAERNRLARDLHDTVSQSLLALSLMAEVLPAVWQKDRAEGQQTLKELHRLAQSAQVEMRTLLLELRLPALTEACLGDLLRKLAEIIIAWTRLPIEVVVQGQGVLPPEVQVALYRIAQETLNNAAKHAAATHVTVNLHYFPAEGAEAGVELRLCDDGCGFDMAQVSLDQLGLGIMRERAETIGASFQIESQPGQGTQVVVQWRDR
ncbi:two-component system, NarL family, nitrate/nitrite sensor histidine kinase NarX [Thermoflexales bacterium]|nr:two-component system, NarL family, nitrate/nitrite sensor histidine kinase NarX [Thermoflexales bacterium]